MLSNLAHLLHLQGRCDESLECITQCEAALEGHEKSLELNMDLAPARIQKFKRRLQVRRAKVLESKADFEGSLEALKVLLRKDYK